MISSPSDIAFSKNSRLSISIGSENLNLLSKFKVGIYGANLVGCEVIKNLMLLNVGNINVIDDEPVSDLDIKFNFFLKNEDKGKTRSEIVTERMYNLNASCKLKHTRSEPTGLPSIEWISKQNIIIITKMLPLNSLYKISEYCHENKIGFISAVTIGTAGVIFDDFGTCFQIKSPNGQPPKSAYLSNIQNIKNPVINLVDNVKFPINTIIEFVNVEGMPTLNGRQAKVIRNGTTICFDIDLSNEPEFDKNKKLGQVIQVRKAEIFNHNSLKNSDINDKYCKLFLACSKFYEENERMPDANDIKIEGFSERFMTAAKFEYPFAAISTGAQAAQEALKYCTHCFRPPRNQWGNIDLSFSLSEHPPKENVDPLTVVLGEECVQRIKESTFLVAGVGAIGCEYIRSLSLFRPRKMILFDNDTIVPSNLTRQFLFRPGDEGLPKVEVGARAIKEFSPTTEVVYKKELFDKSTAGEIDLLEISALFSAVDSSSSRIFISEIGISLRIPMVNSGMMNCDGDCEVVVPGKTRSFPAHLYRKMSTEFKKCTVTANPRTPEHCIQYCVESFSGEFFVTPTEVFGAESLANIKDSHLQFIETIPGDVKECALWAFEWIYNSCVEYPRLHGFPGVAFESGEEMWIKAIRNATALKARLHNIEYTPADIANVMALVDESKIRRIQPKKPTFDVFKERIRGREVRPFHFDPDDMVHVNLMYAFSVLRCRAHNVEPCSMIGCLKFASSIAPTMPTTTSAVGACAVALYAGAQRPEFGVGGISLSNELSLANVSYLFGKALPGTVCACGENISEWEELTLVGATCKDLIDKSTEVNEGTSPGFNLMSPQGQLDLDFIYGCEDEKICDVLMRKYGPPQLRDYIIVLYDLDNDKKLPNIIVRP